MLGYGTCQSRDRPPRRGFLNCSKRLLDRGLLQGMINVPIAAREGAAYVRLNRTVILLYQFREPFVGFFYPRF